MAASRPSLSGPIILQKEALIITWALNVRWWGRAGKQHRAWWKPSFHPASNLQCEIQKSIQKTWSEHYTSLGCRRIQGNRFLFLSLCASPGPHWRTCNGSVLVLKHTCKSLSHLLPRGNWLASLKTLAETISQLEECDLTEMALWHHSWWQDHIISMLSGHFLGEHGGHSVQKPGLCGEAIRSSTPALVSPSRQTVGRSEWTPAGHRLGAAVGGIPVKNLERHGSACLDLINTTEFGERC
jgi:hypothetical protein